jgi:hypothetical protein
MHFTPVLYDRPSSTLLVPSFHVQNITTTLPLLYLLHALSFTATKPHALSKLLAVLYPITQLLATITKRAMFVGSFLGSLVGGGILVGMLALTPAKQNGFVKWVVVSCWSLREAVWSKYDAKLREFYQKTNAFVFSSGQVPHPPTPSH